MSQHVRPPGPRGRGATDNPRNRFEALHVELDAEEGPASTTIFLDDASRSVIATNDSPDIPFDASLNPYRGCEHGCAYCYARPTHEYLGWSAGLDFESRILVKRNAAALLRRELAAPRWRPRLLALSGVTDAYQPIERRLGITRACLQVLAEFRNPVAIVTKNELVTRDLDLLVQLAAVDAAAVFVSITTLDDGLSRLMEPRTSQPRRRLLTLQRLAAAGVPCGVMVAPVVPGLNDHEIPAILAAAQQHGATHAGRILLRLPGAVAPLFDDWLQRHFPDRRDKVLNRIRELRDGQLNDPRFGERMRGHGPWADHFEGLFAACCRRLQLHRDAIELSTAAFRRPGQLPLL